MSSRKLSLSVSRPLFTAALFAVALLAGSETAADAPKDYDRLFAFEADVPIPAGTTPFVSLELSKDVLVRTESDLSDLRLLDAKGVEVPYLLDRSDRQRTREVKARVEVRALGVERTRDVQRKTVTEAYTLTIPAEVVSGGAWQLVFDTDRRNFARQVTFEVINPGGERQVLSRASIFRVSSGRVARDRVPAEVLAGHAGELRVTLTGDDSAYLEPRFHFESTETLLSGSESVIELEVKNVSRDGQSTTTDLLRPAGVVPSAIRIQTTTPFYDRTVSVFDVRSGGDQVPLGTGRVFRTDGITSELHDVGVAQAQTSTLRVVVHDLDSQPLTETHFFAVIDQPRLLFAAPDGGDAVTWSLRFGGGRARRAEYDVARFGDLATNAELLPGAVSLYDPAKLRDATLGTVRANASFEKERALLADLLAPGPVIDDRFFEYRRDLTAAKNATGLYHLRTRPEDNARSASGFADLRVVDATRRQWPYLRVPADEPGWTELDVQLDGDKQGKSTYTLSSALGPLTLRGVRFHIAARMFERAARIEARDAKGKWRTLVAATLSRGEKDDPSVPMEVDFKPVRTSELRLIVDDGNNAPLAIAVVEGAVPEEHIYFVAKPGAYAVLLGNPTAKAPEYDLARMPERVLNVVATEPTLGTLDVNPRFNARARLLAGGQKEHTLLWVVLGLATLVLAAVTARLARKESDGGDA